MMDHGICSRIHTDSILMAYHNSKIGTRYLVSRILARVTRIVDLIAIERVEKCIATSISCPMRSKIEDFYGNVKWKLKESLTTTLQEAKMHGKETFS